MQARNLDLVSKLDVFWDLLFKMIYQETSLESIKVNDEVCYQAETGWSEETPGNKEMKKCSAYWGNECCWSTKELPKDAEITFQIEIDDFDFKQIPDFETIPEIIGEFLSNLTPQTNFFSSKEIIIINPQGPNADHRGSDHLIYKIPMIPKVSLGKTFTFADILQAAYKIKSHHFDSWYELYCRIDNIIEDKNRLAVRLTFDHGS